MPVGRTPGWLSAHPLACGIRHLRPGSSGHWLKATQVVGGRTVRDQDLPGEGERCLLGPSWWGWHLLGASTSSCPWTSPPLPFPASPPQKRPTGAAPCQVSWLHFSHLNRLQQLRLAAPREAQVGDRERQRRGKALERSSDGYRFVIRVSGGKGADS